MKKHWRWLKFWIAWDHQHGEETPESSSKSTYCKSIRLWRVEPLGRVSDQTRTSKGSRVSKSSPSSQDCPDLFVMQTSGCWCLKAPVLISPSEIWPVVYCLKEAAPTLHGTNKHKHNQLESEALSFMKLTRVWLQCSADPPRYPPASDVLWIKPLFLNALFSHVFDWFIFYPALLIHLNFSLLAAAVCTETIPRLSFHYFSFNWV